MLKDVDGVFSEQRKARASRGVWGHTPLEHFENLGLLLLRFQVTFFFFFFEKKTSPIQGECFS